MYHNIHKYKSQGYVDIIYLNLINIVFYKEMDE